MIVFAVSVMTVLLAILYLLCCLSSRLYKIHLTMDLIHQDLVKVFIGVAACKQEPQKKRVYYFDENGRRHWRKND